MNHKDGGLWVEEDRWLMCDRVPTGFMCIERSVIEGRAPAASTEPEQAVAAMNAAFAKAMEALLDWCKGALPAK